MISNLNPIYLLLEASPFNKAITQSIWGNLKGKALNNAMMASAKSGMHNGKAIGGQTLSLLKNWSSGQRIARNISQTTRLATTGKEGITRATREIANQKNIELVKKLGQQRKQQLANAITSKNPISKPTIVQKARQSYNNLAAARNNNTDTTAFAQKFKSQFGQAKKQYVGKIGNSKYTGPMNVTAGQRFTNTIKNDINQTSNLWGQNATGWRKNVKSGLNSGYNFGKKAVKYGALGTGAAVAGTGYYLASDK